MKYRILLLLFAVLISFSCNKDESVVGTDTSTGTTSVSIVITTPNGGETLHVGDAQTIKWTSTTTDKLKIELSINGGASWSTLADSIANTQSYTWSSIPNSPSDSCLIRITDRTNTKNVDISDYYFKIIKYVPKNIALTSPNGGENLIGGKSAVITWTELNIDKVKLEYSINGGLTWNVFQTSYPADSLKYTWNPIPSVVASTCKIRVSDASSDTIYDASDANFNIISIQSIAIVAPTYNEELYIGSSYEIKWIANDMQYVKIEYSIDNGATYNTIASITPNDSSFIWYNIPNTASTTCRLRISDAIDGTPAVVSPSTFIISNKPELNLTAPNGGDTLTAGGSTTITWETNNTNKVAQQTGAVTTVSQKKVKKSFTETSSISKKVESIKTKLVKLQYSTDSGTTWTLITASTANSGSYTWNPIPNIISDKCRVRISDAVNGTPTDSSSSDFSIVSAAAKTLSLTSPVGAESWAYGTTQKITWTSTGLANVKLEYTTDGGVSYNTIVSSYAASARSYTWTVPNVSSNTCKIRISDASNSTLTSLSPAYFALTPAQLIKINTPANSEVITAGTSYNIQWTSENVLNVKIEFTTDNGVNWSTIVASTESDGFYVWNPVPYLSSSNCRIRISDAADGSPSVLNDQVFSVITKPAIQVLVPNTNLTWVTGSSQSIKWYSSKLSKVRIEYTTNSGASWNTITDSIENNGTYPWTIPNINSTLCKIKISDPTGGVPSDESDSCFAISNEVHKALTVTSPNGGESWQASSVQPITWSSTAISKVKIEYTTDNGYNWGTIVDSTASSGLYQWNPIPQTSSTSCKVRISEVPTSTLSDVSDATFTINPIKALQITYPNGGEVWTGGKADTIKWTSSGVAKVTIQYTYDGIPDNISVEGWATIVSGIANSGFYIWSASQGSTGYRIRIFDYDNSSPVDESDGSFIVLPQPTYKITVLKPNGGENIMSGQKDVIQWASTNIPFVDLDYTIDGGANWLSIEKNLSSTGFYSWSVPAGMTSSMCRVRVKDTPTGLYSDVSDTLFSIIQAKQIKVSFPNKTTDYVMKDTAFTWYSTGVATVNLELSLDNGVTWRTLAAGVSSTGAYMYKIGTGADITALGRFRVTDSTDPTVFDINDEPFNIAQKSAADKTTVSPPGKITKPPEIKQK
jgi:anti-sigma28 factor (negative regulator of flagellin synthesis)